MMPAQKYASARDAVRELLSDGQWRTWRELEAVAGNRYGARLDELRAAGVLVQDEDLPTDGKRYRMLDGKTMPRTRRVRVYLEVTDAAEMARGNVTLFAQTEAKRALRGRK